MDPVTEYLRRRRERRLGFFLVGAAGAVLGAVTCLTLVRLAPRAPLRVPVVIPLPVTALVPVPVTPAVATKAPGAPAVRYDWPCLPGHETGGGPYSKVPGPHHDSGGKWIAVAGHAAADPARLLAVVSGDGGRSFRDYDLGLAAGEIVNLDVSMKGELNWTLAASRTLGAGGIRRTGALMLVDATP